MAESKSAQAEITELQETIRRIQDRLSSVLSELEDARSTLQAIQSGEVDAVVVKDAHGGAKVMNLSSAEHPQRVFVEAMAEGAVTVSADGVILFCNPRFAEMLKTDSRRVIGRRLIELVSPAEQEMVEYLLQEGLMARLQQELTFLKADGSRLQVSLSLAPVRADDLHGICILATDLSEKHRTEAALRRALERARLVEEMERALRLREEFLSISSHELRTPITAMLIKLQLVQRSLRERAQGRLGPESIQHSVETAIKHAKRLIVLVENLLDVSQIEAGKLALTREETDLSALIHEVVERYSEHYEDAGIALAIEPEVRGAWDRARIEQVIINLLSNAFKYGSGAKVEILLAKQGDEAVLTVRDYGPGIPPSEQARIFSKFERAVSSRSISGFGLGLYVAKEIVEAHGGEIHVRSLDGEGTAFMVRLPLRVTESRRQRGAA